MLNYFKKYFRKQIESYNFYMYLKENNVKRNKDLYMNENHVNFIPLRKHFISKRINFKDQIDCFNSKQIKEGILPICVIIKIMLRVFPI
jgi:hypothetical protein